MSSLSSTASCLSSAVEGGDNGAGCVSNISIGRATVAASREADQPDAFVYHDDDGDVFAFCAHCVTIIGRGHRYEGAAWSGAVRHLWSTHSLRRSWIDESDPRYRSAVQMALPIVLAHNTSRPA